MLEQIEKNTGGRGLVARLKRWMKDVFRHIGKTFGTWTDDALNELSLNDFINMPLRDFVDGVNPNNYKYSGISSDISVEMEQIRQNAIADGTFMKAPNGKKSNLTERQWLQVRTKSFKDWFGDWEKAYNWSYRLYDITHPYLSDNERDDLIARFNKGEDVVIYAGSNNIRQLLDGIDFRKTGVGLNRQDGVFYASYSLGYAQDYANQYANNGTNLDHIGVAKITINKGTTKGGISFDASEIRISDPSIIKSIEDVTGTKNYDKVRVATRKSKDVSKVIDENGEPLVVYHHTDNPDLTEFSVDFDNYFTKDGGTKKAVFFDENKTGTLNRKYDIPVFLNIRDLRTYNGTKEDLHKAGTTYRAIVNESAEANDVTGGLHMHDFDDNKLEHQDVWIVHNPNQIKSATDNNGEFSVENDDINFMAESDSEDVGSYQSEFNTDEVTYEDENADDHTLRNMYTQEEWDFMYDELLERNPAMRRMAEEGLFSRDDLMLMFTAPERSNEVIREEIRRGI